MSANLSPVARNGLQAEPAAKSIAGQSLLVTVPESRPRHLRGAKEPDVPLSSRKHFSGRNRSRLLPFFFAAASKCTTSL